MAFSLLLATSSCGGSGDGDTSTGDDAGSEETTATDTTGTTSSTTSGDTGDSTDEEDTGPQCESTWEPCDPPEGRCVDADGDQFGDGCAAGPDCDDADPTVRPGGFELPGDGIDQDCQDGDAVLSDAAGIFVDGALGDDANPGTMAAPFATVTAAEMVAEASNLPLFVAAGDYEEGDLVITVSIFGGFDSAWNHDPFLHITRLGGALTLSGASESDPRDLVADGLAVDGTIGGNSWSGFVEIRQCEANTSRAWNNGVEVPGSGVVWRTRAWTGVGTLNGTRAAIAADNTWAAGGWMVASQNEVWAGDPTADANGVIGIGMGCADGGCPSTTVLAHASNNLIHLESAGADGRGLLVMHGNTTDATRATVVSNTIDATGTAGRSAVGIDVDGATAFVANNFIAAREGSGPFVGARAFIDSDATMVHNTIYVRAAGRSDVTGMFTADDARAQWMNNVVVMVGETMATQSIYVENDAVTYLEGNLLSEGVCPVRLEEEGTCIDDPEVFACCEWDGCAEAHALTVADAQLVDPESLDLHLGEGSPAIDAGASLAPTCHTLPSDIDGESRPAGAAADVGADERP